VGEELSPSRLPLYARGPRDARDRDELRRNLADYRRTVGAGAR